MRRGFRLCWGRGWSGINPPTIASCVRRVRYRRRDVVQDFCLDGRPIARMIDCRRQPLTNVAARLAWRAAMAVAELTTPILIHAGAPR
jgi:hypothetical protein